MVQAAWKPCRRISREICRQTAISRLLDGCHVAWRFQLRLGVLKDGSDACQRVDLFHGYSYVRGNM